MPQGITPQKRPRVADPAVTAKKQAVAEVPTVAEPVPVGAEQHAAAAANTTTAAASIATPAAAITIATSVMRVQSPAH